MIPLAFASSLLTGRNLVIGLIVLLCLIVGGEYLYYTAKVAILENKIVEVQLERVQLEKKLADLLASNKIMEYETIKNQASIDILRNNVKALKDQIRKNEQICNNTIDDLIHTCKIINDSTNEELEKKLMTIDPISSRKIINVLNKKYKELNQ